MPVLLARACVTECNGSGNPLDFPADPCHTNSMKNKTALSNLAANGTPLDLLVAQVQGQVTVKKLRRRGPRKGETLSRGQAGGRPAADGNRPVGQHVACNGGWAANGQVGYGAQKIANADAAKARFDRVHASEARARAVDRAAEREAAAYAALDALLEG